MTWVYVLAMTGGILSPYQEEDERKSIRKQQSRPDQEKSTGAILPLPSLWHLGASYYPIIRFEETDFSSRTGSGIDTYFSVSTFLSGIVPCHTQIGIMRVEDKADFDLTIVKLGAGIHPALAGNLNLDVSFGTAYLHGGDVSGRRFTTYMEIRLGVRNLFLPGSLVSIGYFDISNINARIDSVDLETIEGFRLTIGFGG